MVSTSATPGEVFPVQGNDRRNVTEKQASVVDLAHRLVGC